ncbi:MAG TPA: hypothetical protein DCM86_02385, partial [Verrucomicrobiales bacterium]|nr:hypothetical protein [Verrucomicrobiales bacterium]
RVTALDEGSGRPLTNAEAFLTIGAGDARFFLDHAAAGSTGEMTLHYNPAQTVEYTVWIRAPGHQPARVERSRGLGADLRPEIRIPLPPGTEAGGVVQDAKGAPVPGARVTVFRNEGKGRGNLLRVEYEEVWTDTRGNWRSHSLPAELSGFQFEVGKPGEASLIARVSGSKGKGLEWSLEELRQGKAVATLGSSAAFEVSLSDEGGKPVGGARTFAIPEDGRPPRFLMRGDATGRIAMSAGRFAGASKVVLLADGFAPSILALEASDSSQGVRQVTLTRLSRLVGRVSDQAGLPVAGAEVRVLGWNDTDLLTYSGVTDSRGAFTWTNAAQGVLNIRLSCTNFMSANYGMAWDGGELSMTLSRQTMAFGRVVDEENGRPIPEFTVIRGYSYGRQQPINWERYNPVRGRNGAYSVRMNNYGSESRVTLMVEAPGYLPAAAVEWAPGAWYTNDFRLKRGRGVSGVVLLPDGTPAAGVNLVLVEVGDSAYLDRPGQLSRSSSYSDQVQSDRQGKFEFQPRLRAGRVIAVHESGIADLSVEEVKRSGRVPLQRWGRVEGLFKIGAGLEPNQSVLLKGFSMPYYSSDIAVARSSGLSMNFRTVPDADGRFLFEKVPPGEVQVLAEYKFIERRNGGGPTPLSHGVVVDVLPAKTSSVTLGGGGRRLEGRVKVVGGDPEEVNWLNDVHQLDLILPPPPGQPQFAFNQNDDEETRARKQNEYGRLMNEFSNTPAGRAHARKARAYVCVFETNGTFHVDNVLPGNYTLRIAPREYQPNYYNGRQLGWLQQPVSVPEGGGPNAPLDVGSFELRIAGRPRMGRPAPDFSLETIDGKRVQSGDLRGKAVVLYFWATWGLDARDEAVLKAAAEAPGAESRTVILAVNVDSTRQTAETFLKGHKVPGTV